MYTQTVHVRCIVNLINDIKTYYNQIKLCSKNFLLFVLKKNTKYFADYHRLTDRVWYVAQWRRLNRWRTG